MTIVNLHEAKTHLSRLVDRASRGESFVIAKAGKPLVRVTAIEAPSVPQRLGFLEGELRVPEDFDDMGREQIVEWFAGRAVEPEVAKQTRSTPREKEKATGRPRR
jgi:prevent-host-death family protein